MSSHPHRSIRQVMATLGLVAALLVAGCSDDDPDATSTTSTTDTPAPGTQGDDDQGEAAAAAGSQAYAADLATALADRSAEAAPDDAEFSFADGVPDLAESVGRPDVPVGRAPAADPDRVTVNVGVSFVPLPGWSQWAKGDFWQIWGKDDAPLAYADITAEKLDEPVLALSSIQFMLLQNVMVAYEDVQLGEIYEADPAPYGDAVYSVASSSWQGVMVGQNGERYPVEAVIVAMNLKDGRSIIFNAITNQGEYADHQDDFSTMFASIGVDVADGQSSTTTTTTAPEGDGDGPSIGIGNPTTSAPATPTTSGSPTTSGDGPAISIGG